MKKILISLLAGILIGGAGVFAWARVQADEQANRELAEAEERESEMSRLRRELAGERSAATVLRRQVESAGIDTTPVKEDQIDLQRLLNDARPLMKSLALMFGKERKKMTERWITGMAEKLAEEMGLSVEQTNDMIAHFLKLDDENFEKIKAMLDRPMSLVDVFTAMKDMNPQKSMDDYVMAKMTDEQKKSWENRKLESKAQQIERTATWQLERMSSLNLDETQKDQVFDILVKKNPQFDPALAVEGVNADGGALDANMTQEEAIAGVLRPEQMEEWKTMQERRNAEKKRWTDALGGFDPTQLFQGMGGGMGFGPGGFGGRSARGGRGR